MISGGANMKATMAERGQVTIPKPLRKKLGIQPGMVLDFHDENGRLIAVKVTVADPVEQVYGILKPGKKTDALVRELRGEL
jgi:AbrB family looped-hinge helix DNA binding protein